MFESYNKEAALAVDKLRRAALAAEVPKTEIAKRLGVRRQTVSAHFNAGDMKLTEFVSTARLVGVNPSEILQEAMEEK